MKHTLLIACFTLLLGAFTNAAVADVPPYDVTVRPTAPAAPQFSLGMGLGPLYGEGGANLEYFATSQLSATVAVGLHPDPGWFAGGRFYMKPPGHGPRSRITAGVAQTSNQFIGFGNVSGRPKVILAVGASWANEDTEYRGFDFDITTQGTLSIGYHF